MYQAIIESVLTYRVRVEKIRWRPQDSTEHPQVKFSWGYDGQFEEKLRPQ